MKNVSSIKTNAKGESPKTPGGISKSLLTPCRRVGLSRNWKKAGKSPFVSPIPGNSSSVDVKQDKTETRKRKERNCEEETECNEAAPKTHIEKEKRLDIENDLGSSPLTDKSKDIIGTPSRSVEIPRKKKSKTLLSAINNSKENICGSNSKESDEPAKNDTEKPITEKFPDKCDDDLQQLENPVLPKDVKSSKKNKKLTSPIKSNVKKREADIKCAEHDDSIKEISDVSTKENLNSEQQIENISRNKSPNLTKECIVVIQKNILKTDGKESEQVVVDSTESNKTNENNDASQTLFDSEIDEVPLSHLNKKEKKKSKAIDSDEDFSEATNNTKVKKLEDKNTSTGNLKKSSTVKSKTNKKSTKTLAKATVQTVIESKPLSQSSNSFDDDDEDFEFNKRTILIRKSYDKVSKPIKAKSTGSITLKDIDELKAKIEMKKKLLLAKAMSKDTEELRGLIKKWQKGCQNALAELMDLMKSKYPDKQNMDYSEILQMLKIPAGLVGYDSDNDCFVTPDDSSVILSNFNDL